MKGFSNLVDVLTLRSDDTGAWTITSDEVIAALGVPPVAFWRAVHSLRMKVAFSDAVDGFSQDSVGDLVTVLESLSGSAAVDAMGRAGLFIQHELGVELTETFLTDVGRFCAAHDINTDELAAMIRHAGSVRGGIAIYLGEYVDRELLIEGAAEAFRYRFAMPDVAQATAARYVRNLFTRHILDGAQVVTVLVERLRLAAAVMGFVDPEDDARRRRARGADGAGARDSNGPAADRRTWAFRVMGLPAEDMTADDLRRRYRTLMMRHHPDVDPAGLELCKDVNVAYALLISGTTGA
jgi:hypothetical protein